MLHCEWWWGERFDLIVDTEDEGGVGAKQDTQIGSGPCSVVRSCWIEDGCRGRDLVARRETRVWGWSFAVVVIVPLPNILELWCQKSALILIRSCAWVSERGAETVGGAVRDPDRGKLWRLHAT